MQPPAGCSGHRDVFVPEKVQLERQPKPSVQRNHADVQRQRLQWERSASRPRQPASAFGSKFTSSQTVLSVQLPDAHCSRLPGSKSPSLLLDALASCALSRPRAPPTFAPAASWMGARSDSMMKVPDVSVAAPTTAQRTVSSGTMQTREMGMKAASA